MTRYDTLCRELDERINARWLASVADLLQEELTDTTDHALRQSLRLLPDLMRARARMIAGDIATKALPDVVDR